MKLIIRGKHIWGLDDSFDSILIEDDKIVAVGDYSDLSSPEITTHNYTDCLILPGFTDAHLHMGWLGKTLAGCNLSDVSNPSEFKQIINEHIDKLSDDEFLIGYGLDERTWDEPVSISRDMIDSVSGNHPVIIGRTDGHSWLINSKLVIISGINRITDSKYIKHIQLDDNNNPTGIIYDKAYSELIQHLLPKHDSGATKKHILLSQKNLLSMGITSCRSFGKQENLMALAELEQNGLLKMRVCGCIPQDSLDWAISIATKTGNGSDMFWVGQLKLFLDGSLGSQTALMSKPYPNGSTGLGLIEYDELESIVIKAHSNDIGVAIHAIGDVAVDRAVKVFSDYNNPNDTIEHFQCASKEAIEKVSKKTSAGVILNPSHIPLDQQSIEQNWPSLTDRVYPTASLISAGAKVGFGSDAPVTTANPLYAVASATTRRGANTGLVNPKEAIPFNKAMHIATLGSAEIIGGPKRGQIKKGCKADITVISEDFRGKNPWDIDFSSFVATYVDGKKVWEK